MLNFEAENWSSLFPLLKFRLVSTPLKGQTFDPSKILLSIIPWIFQNRNLLIDFEPYSGGRPTEWFLVIPEGKASKLDNRFSFSLFMKIALLSLPFQLESTTAILSFLELRKFSRLWNSFGITLSWANRLEFDRCPKSCSLINNLEF